MNPSYKTFIDGKPYLNQNFRFIQNVCLLANDNGGSTMVEVPIAIPDGSSAEILLKTWPTVGGFSFYAKRWAEIRVDSLKPLKVSQKGSLLISSSTQPSLRISPVCVVLWYSLQWSCYGTGAEADDSGSRYSAHIYQHRCYCVRNTGPSLCGMA